ncbi:MAG TPA: hypothetical protein VNG69_08165 [Casimicrobiaceae bacterium]|nr:hypothetical protein [Casimicrobiaceae bacterium]
MNKIAKMFNSATAAARKAGPYLLIEILLPGGTLFALLLYLYRSRASGNAQPLQEVLDSVRRTLLQFQPYDMVSLTNAAANDRDGLGPIAMVPPIEPAAA